jgi:hypothetical protein
LHHIGNEPAAFARRHGADLLDERPAWKTDPLNARRMRLRPHAAAMWHEAGFLSSAARLTIR